MQSMDVHCRRIGTVEPVLDDLNRLVVGSEIVDEREVDLVSWVDVPSWSWDAGVVASGGEANWITDDLSRLNNKSKIEPSIFRVHILDFSKLNGCACGDNEQQK